MLHALLADARFWQFLHRLDEDLAATAGAARCPHCGGVLHRGDYPRKPRGVGRALLGPAYERRRDSAGRGEPARNGTTADGLLVKDPL